MRTAISILCEEISLIKICAKIVLKLCAREFVKLHFLFAAEKELIRQMLMLPIRADTMKVRAKKTELEAKLAEIEEAIKIFSGRKVFVKLDS